MMFLAAGGDPLSHVLPHNYLEGTSLAWLGLTNQVVFMLLGAVLAMIIFPLIARRIQANHTGGRLGHFFEAILLFVRDEVVRPALGKEGDKFLPIIWTFFFFILFCNLLGLIPHSGTATGNINTTAALALVSFLFYEGVGIYKHGLFGYLKASLCVGPPLMWPLMIPVEIIGHIIRPCALAIRLFANMVAGHTMLGVFLGFCLAFSLTSIGTILGGGAVAFVSVLASVAVYFLEILVAFIQAFIFTFLTTVFLSMSVHPDH